MELKETFWLLQITGFFSWKTIYSRMQQSKERKEFVEKWTTLKTPLKRSFSMGESLMWSGTWLHVWQTPIRLFLFFLFKSNKKKAGLISIVVITWQSRAKVVTLVYENWAKVFQLQRTWKSLKRGKLGRQHWFQSLFCIIFAQLCRLLKKRQFFLTQLVHF